MLLTHALFMSFFRDLKALSEQPEGLSADPLDEPELLHTSKAPILLTISEDLMSARRANPLKLTELSEGGLIDVKARRWRGTKLGDHLAVEPLRLEEREGLQEVAEALFERLGHPWLPTNTCCPVRRSLRWSPALRQS